ncbi:sugar-binding protein [Salipaludibacillus sp. HK11]|uniref:sugar-binding protein n=1 Tax=Salipaludibacillus sp. HK11 TaxID=3394320 RepID=UPI0039FCC8D5
MKRKSIIYIVLIVAFIGTLFLSYYYYTKADYYDAQISKALSIETSTKTHHFALITEEMDHEYWNLVGEGAKQAEDSYDVFVEYMGTRGANPEEQVELIDMAIAAKVDGIIVQAIRDEVFDPMIDKAINQGIPVITVDSDSPTSSRLAYIGTDNYQSGRMAGEALINDNNGEAVVGIITNSVTSSSQNLRVKGFEDALADAEGIEVVTIEESSNSRVIAAQKTDMILTEYEHINAFFGTSALDGLGISASIQERDQKDDIYIIAFDALDETLKLLEDEKIDAVVSQQPFQMGFQSVELMLDIINERPVEEVTHTGTDIIRKADIKHFNKRLGGLR